MPRSGRWAALVLAAVVAGRIIVTGQITVPNTFVNGTVADAPQVNANFNAVAANALNRTGGTMTGTLTSRDITPSADNTYSLGTHALRFLNLATTGTTEFNTHIYTWSSTQGAAGQVLANNGSDTLSWATTAPVSLGTCNLALTLTSGNAEPTADVTAATNVYVTPINGGQCAFYDGAATWTPLTNAEVTIPVPATTATIYDVWCRNNAGTIACDTTAWSSDSARATALTTQNNIVVKTGDTTRRFIGIFRTTAVSGQTEDSVTKAYLANYYIRRKRPLQRYETTSSWGYTLATVRQANGAPANQVEIIVPVAGPMLELSLNVENNNSAGSLLTSFGIGEDSTTTYVVGNDLMSSAGDRAAGTVLLTKHPAIGRHTYSWNEWSTASSTTTWYGAVASAGSTINHGLSGWFER